MSVLDEISDLLPGLADSIVGISDAFDRRLWHQFSTRLLSLMQSILIDGAGLAPEKIASIFYSLFDRYVQNVRSSLNALVLARMTVLVARTLCGVQRVDDGTKILMEIRAFVEKQGARDAFVFCETELALLALYAGKQKECRDSLERCKELMDGIVGLDNIVYSNFYRVECEYLKAASKITEFYQNALLFLAYTPLDTMPIDEQRAIAYDIGIAALLSENVYNFGELIAHHILDKLVGTQSEFLFELIYVFNTGLMQNYEVTVEKYRDQLGSDNLLVSNAANIVEKMRIISLMQYVFSSDSSSREFSFTEIASCVDLKESEAELLVLRALATGVVKGYIDEVDRKFVISWVQPRVLSTDQLQIVQNKFESWVGRVAETRSFLAEETPEFSS